jgi:hypothetical protein
MKKVIIPSLLLMSIMTMAFQCNRNIKRCEDTVCTMIFMELALKINSTASLGNIEVKVKDVNNNTTVRISTTPMPGSTDQFLLINDGDFGFLGQVNATESYIVEVWQNSVLKQTLNYEFGRDCCHVFKKSGPDSITI